MSLQLEEILLWKLVEYLHLDGSQPQSSPTQMQPPNPLLPALEPIERPDPLKAIRCYFGRFLVNLPRLYLSVLALPSTALPAHLRQLKQRQNLALVRFENAPVTLPHFQQLYCFETVDFLMDALQKHYSRKWSPIGGNCGFSRGPAALGGNERRYWGSLPIDNYAVNKFGTCGNAMPGI